jgi:hypothetical protein
MKVCIKSKLNLEYENLRLVQGSGIKPSFLEKIFLYINKFPMQK